MCVSRHHYRGCRCRRRRNPEPVLSVRTQIFSSSVAMPMCDALAVVAHREIT